MKKTNLDLQPYLNIIAEERCVVAKLADDFPPLKVGSDLDIFCENKQLLGQKILAVAYDDIMRGYTVNVEDSASEGYLHIDFLKNGRLQARLDVRGDLACFTKVKLVGSYKKRLLDARVMAQKGTGEEKYDIPIPAVLDELIIRFAEYAQYPHIPAKRKHLEYVRKHLKSERIYWKFFIRLLANVDMLQISKAALRKLLRGVK